MCWIPVSVDFFTWKEQLGHDQPASFLFRFCIYKSERETFSNVLVLALYLSLCATLTIEYR